MSIVEIKCRELKYRVIIVKTKGLAKYIIRGKGKPKKGNVKSA